MDWWEPIGIAVTAVLAIAALVQNHRGTKASGQKASEADSKAQRALDAAESSAAAADRSANAVERMAEAMQARAAEAERGAAEPGVAWTVEHLQGVAFLLRNVGRAPALDVKIGLHPTVNKVGDDLDHDLIGPSGGVKFFASLSLATTDDTVTVSWTERPGGPRHTWRRPLPPSR
jgi:hypothetical protein